MKRLLAALLLSAAASPALATTDCPNCTVVVGSITSLQNLGSAASQYPTVQVVSYYGTGTTGGGIFNFTTPCPASSGDGGIYFFPSGVSSGCYVRQLDGTGKFSADWYGVVPNNVGTDYTANFLAAIAAINPATSVTGLPYTLMVDPGKYQITAQWTGIGNGAHIICNSNWNPGCTFYVMSNFTGLSTGGAMIIGDATTAIFGATIEGMDIEFASPGGAFASSIGMTAYNCQDMCGFQRDFINGPNGSCFQMTGAGSFNSVNTYIFKNNTCFGAQSGTVNGPLFLFKNGIYPGEVNNIDGFCFTAHCPTNGFEYNNLPAVGSQITLEGPFTNGILVDASVPLTSITNAVVQFHSASGNAVNITSSSGAQASVYLAGIERCCGGTNGQNSIVDNGNGLGYQFTTTDIAPMPYSRGQNQYSNGITTKVNSITYQNNAGREGTFTCNGASTVVVSNTNAAANDVISSTIKSISGSQGAQPVVTAISATTSFSIVCTAGDNSTYNYVMIGHP